MAEKAAKIKDVSSVVLADSSAFEHFAPEPLSPLIARAQKTGGFSHIVAPATAFGRNVLPRVGALLDVQPISEVIAIKSDDTFVRPTYAGNAIATVKSTDAVKLLTVRTTAFDKVAAEGGAAQITAMPQGTYSYR